MAQENVWGKSRLKLFKGACRVTGRKSDRSLYQPSFATFEEDDVYQQNDATGFIKLHGLRLQIESLVRRQTKA